MAKLIRYIYECIARSPCPWCDMGYRGPDQRRNRWIRKGKSLLQPTRTLHVVRCFTNADDKGNRWKPPDYIITNKPLAKRYTEATTIKVSRQEDPAHGKTNRVLRERTSRGPKFRLLDADEVTDYIRANAYDFGDDWDESLFQEGPEIVRRPDEPGAFAEVAG